MDSRITNRPLFIPTDISTEFNVFREESGDSTIIIVTDEEFNAFTTFPAETTLEVIKAFINGYGKGYREGTRHGEISLQSKIQKLLGL